MKKHQQKTFIRVLFSKVSSQMPIYHIRDKNFRLNLSVGGEINRLERPINEMKQANWFN